MDLQLNNHTALITGAASGIGLATARMLAQEGCAVVCWDVSDGVVETAKAIGEQCGVQSFGQIVDISHTKATADALQACLLRVGSVQHVVHCAAVGSGRFGFPFTNLSPDDWNRVLDINVKGMVNVAHAVTPHFVDRQEGTFVFVASVAGQIGSQTDPPYSASKAANINFAQCMAKDLARHGVRVNTVCPGMVKTELNRSVWQAWYDAAEPGERLSYDEWAMNKIRAIVPLGCWQTPEDIATMIVFLSSPRAGQITGQTVNVDGGFVMHW
jgi:NAD(P)-dependent dehydrogenase (short-subunit alcohol dehydrogenase family)